MAVINLTDDEQGVAVQRQASGLLNETGAYGGSWEDYMVAMSPLGMDMYNPDLALDSHGSGIEMNSEFKAVYDVADADTKEAMLGAKSNMDAFKIYERRAVEDLAFQDISKNSLGVQLGVGMLAGSVSPTTLLPFGAVAGTMYKSAVSASKAMHIAKQVGVGATAGAAAATFDEMLFESNGQHYDYGSALMYGAAFGGGLGMLGGLASRRPELLTSENDSFRLDYDVDHTVSISPEGYVTAVGVEGVAQQNGIAAKIPGIAQLTNFLDSDVAKGFKSPSQVVRDFMTKISPSTVSLRDANGNVISTPKAGTDYRRELAWIFTKTNRGLSDDFRDMKLAGGEYSQKSFHEEIDRHFADTVAKQEVDAYNYAQGMTEGEKLRLDALEFSASKNPDNKTITDALEAVRKEYRTKRDESLDEFFKKKVDWSHSNPYISRGAERYAKYFNDFSDSGKRIGMDEFLRQRDGKLYKPRVYDFDKINKLDDNDLQATFTRAFTNHKSNDDLTVDEVNVLVTNLIDSLHRGDFNQAFTHNSYLLPNAPAESRLAHRKFRMDDRELRDITRNDMNDVVGAYNMQMSGRQSVHYALGTDIGTATDDLYKAIREEGLANDPKVKESVEATVKALEDLGGTLRLNTLSNSKGWQFARTVMAYNSGRLGTGFGANQAIEGAATVSMNGLRNIMAGSFGKGLHDAGKLMFGDGQNISAQSEFVMKLGYMEDALSATRVNAIADTELGLNANMVEKGLHGFNEWLQKWTGMRPLKAAMESNTAAATISEIQKLSKQTKFSEADKARIGRWGLDEQTMRAIGKDIDDNIDMKAGKFELENFKNLDEFQLAVSRGIEEIVIQGNSIHMPRWMKDHTGGPLLKLMTQFMRFPLIAHNQLLKRGVSEDKARMGGSVIAGSMMYMSIKYMLEQAEIASGVREEWDTRYDYFGMQGEEAMTKGLIESLNYSAATGAWSTGINYTANFTGHSELGRNYVARDPLETYLGPSAGLMKDGIEFATTLAQGEMTTEKAMLQGKAFLLMQNAAIVGKAFDATAEGL